MPKVSFKEMKNGTKEDYILLDKYEKQYSIPRLDFAIDFGWYYFLTKPFLYILIFFIITALLSINGLSFITAISAAATSISNVGPGLGDIIGPNGNFSQLNNVSKWILSFGMILGRLELFAVLVLFIPSFWRKY